MNMKEHKLVLALLESNLEALVASEGEATLKGLEVLSPRAIEQFDKLWEHYAPKALEKAGISSSSKKEASNKEAYFMLDKSMKFTGITFL